MKLHLYGSGASEGVPALFCECENCVRFRKLGGKNIRTRTGAMVDEKLLIDFSADTYAHVLYGGLDLRKAEYLIVTHSHEDHLYAADLMTVKPPMAFYNRERRLEVYGNEKTIKKIEAEQKKYGRNPCEMQKYLQLHRIKAFEKVKVGEYEILPLPASHDKNEDCFIYCVTCNGKTLLYGHDTAYFSESVWNALTLHHLDCVVLDCTMVDTTGAFPEHMGLPDNIAVRKRMLENGMADENTVFIATHFTHIFNPEHARIRPIFEKAGIQTAYDGYEIDF